MIGDGREPSIPKQQGKKIRAVGHYSQAIHITQGESTKKADKKPVFSTSHVNNRIKQGFPTAEFWPKTNIAAVLCCETTWEDGLLMSDKAKWKTLETKFGMRWRWSGGPWP